MAIVGGGCGSGNALSPDEIDYAASIAAGANGGLGFSADEANCVGLELVKVFGLARAKELRLAENESVVLSRKDATSAVDAMAKCADLKLVTVRFAKDTLGLTDAQVGVCAAALDKDKVREVFIKIVSGERTAGQAMLMSEISLKGDKCRRA